MKTRTILLAILATVAVAGPVFASLAPPIRISREGDPTYAKADTPYTGSFLIEAGAPLDVELISVSGEGWSGTYISAPEVVRMGQQDSYSVSFGGTPSAAAGPLYLEYAVDGWNLRETLDSGPRLSARRKQVAGVVTPLPDRPVTKSNPRTGDTLAPLPPKGRKARAPEMKTVFDESQDPSGGADKHVRTITVTGRVHFILPRWQDFETDGSWQDGDISRGARGATVRVYDEDSTWDEFLGADLTDDDGNFSVTFNWDPCLTCDGEPDIYIEVESANARIEVEDSVWEDNYTLESATWNDYAGNNLNVGDYRFADEDLQPVFFILSHATRGFDMIKNVAGRTQDTVDYQFPGNGNYYLTLWEEIHISQSRGFNSGTVIHEYGHHYIENFGAWGSMDTCNDKCDDDPSIIEELFGSCGHCRWCAESQGVAWNEGWPQWMADFYGRYHVANHGYLPPTYRIFETTDACQVTGVVETFKRVEGRVAAMMRDLEDSAADNDTINSPYPDAMNDPAERIFAVADLDEPTSAIEFFLDYRSRYSPPEPALWETVTNAGYPNYDFTPPTAPTGFESQTHTVGVPTSARRIFINWEAANDDISQPGKYIYSFSQNAPASPDPSAAGSLDLFGRSVQLNPGIYYANLAVQDRAGNLSNVVSIGPFTITPPPDPDLAFQPRTGWAEPVVPFGSGSLSDGNVPEPFYLVGNNSGATYWNANVVSLGPSGVPAGSVLQVFVDGAALVDLPWDPIDDTVVLSSFNEAPAIVLNRGPFAVPGGRHVFAAHGDATEVVSESDEDNNISGRSWVWSPAPLTAGVDTWRSTPPNPIDGWNDITGGGLYFSCDGLQFESTGWWNAVTLVPENPTTDHDLRLHQPSTSATTGFVSPLGYSTLSAGRTDVVLVNRNIMGRQFWDVAVWRVPTATTFAPFNVRHITSTAFAYGDSIGVTMDTNEMLTLHEVQVPVGKEGPVEVVVRTDPAQGPLRISWFGATFAYGDILDDEAGTITDEFGFARLRVDAPVAGFYCVAVYRDISDANGNDPELFSLEVGLPGVDIAAYTPGNWTSPVVPWEDTDDVNGPIVAPPFLPGFDQNFIHTATRNLSPEASPGPYVQTILLDGVPLASPLLVGGYAGLDSLKSSTPAIIPGGRHTLVMRAEFPGYQTLDTNPVDNLWAEQWVWSPWLLALDVPVAMAAPGDPTGGWTAFINPAQTVAEKFFNCVGARTPLLQPAGLDGNWAAVVATPVDSAGSIVLRLHDQLSTGAKSGFENPFLTSIGGGLGQTEFALVNPGMLNRAQFDVGVLAGTGAQVGNGGFKLAVTKSQYLGVDGVTPVGAYGVWNLPPGRAIRLFEVWLDAGNHGVTLSNLTGGADLGLSIHGGGAAFARGTADSTSGTAWLAPAGMDEYLPLVVAQSGYHVVGVWKAGWSDLDLSADFSLQFTSGNVSGVVPGAGRLVTSIREVRPNPFNPQTTIAFDVEKPGSVEVAIYSLRGRKVRVLQAGHLASGRHERVWNGRDDGGRVVATGTYLVRLRGGDAVDHRKIMLLK